MTTETTYETASLRIRQQGAGAPGYGEPKEGRGFRLSHLSKLATNLGVPFDALSTARDIAELIAKRHTDAQIDEAHLALIATYDSGGFRKKRKPARMREREEAARRQEARETATDAETTDRTSEASNATQEASEAQETAKPVTADAGTMSTAERIAQILAEEEAKRKPAIDEEAVRRLIAEEVAKLKQVKQIEIKQGKALPPIKLGAQHKRFPLLLATANARKANGKRANVWLYGEASSGKSMAAEAVAKAMSLPYYAVNALDQPYKLLGYQDANGIYHSTAFRKAVEHGGVFCFDEYDRSHPSVVIEMNNFLSTGVLWFPDCTDAPIARHPDCIIIATGNTAGMGATAEYNTAQKQDASARTRFAFIEWNIDEDFEAAIASNEQWCQTVQLYRAAARECAIRGFSVSTRATFDGEAFLAAGISHSDTVEMTIRAGLDDEAWRKVKAAYKARV